MKRQSARGAQHKHVHFSTSFVEPPETMASWFERQASSHHAQLAAVAILSGVAVAGSIYGAQAIRREKRVEELKASIPELNDSHHADMVRWLLLRMNLGPVGAD